MAGKSIFLEMAFWDQFSKRFDDLIKDYEEGGDSIVLADRISKWNSLFKLLSRSPVFVDAPLSSLAEKARGDERLLRLLKRKGGGQNDLGSLDESFPDLDSEESFDCYDYYSAIYFTSESHSPGAKKHGVINISIDGLWNHGDKFTDTGIAIRTNQGWNWDEMGILKENSNSMVLIDNYIFSPDRTGQGRLTVNLKSILKKILPNELTEEYFVSIFYHESSTQTHIREERKKHYKEEIEQFIGRIRPNLMVVVELFPTKMSNDTAHKPIHDRTIVTNNIWIGSEAGFDLLVNDRAMYSNTRAVKTTTLHSVYLGFGEEIANWLRQSYDNLKSDAQKFLENYGYTSENMLLCNPNDAS